MSQKRDVLFAARKNGYHSGMIKKQQAHTAPADYKAYACNGQGKA
jgi:ribosome modulation factor